MFGKPSSLELRVEQLEDSIEQLRASWKEWRRQLANAAARLERAETRAVAREAKLEPDPPASREAGGSGLDRIARLNAEILRARGEGRAAQAAGDGVGTAGPGPGATGSWGRPRDLRVPLLRDRGAVLRREADRRGGGARGR